ncbi:MAG TPA: sulfotransferase [Chloroflexota bacterium]|nr:sulfotransferase [Chloroflexota bacterium]
MDVIGAGFGRTGTMSLKVALQQLGFAPCLHMIDLLAGMPELSDTFREAYEGKQVDWKTALKDFRATVDWPGCTFYKEFMELYPNAPVILSVRDPEAWYKSTNDTIFKAAEMLPNMPEIADKPVAKMLKAIVWDGDLQGRFADKDFAISVFEKHNREVQQYVPKERLLVYEVKQGWEPLCSFLGVSVPEEPFPHVNDTKTFWENMTSGSITSGDEARKLNEQSAVGVG